ncbi:DNA repair protein RecO [Chryseobacterium sp.]|uniref:DNA repair protein RecO n=1 Tax=Chryseobacterium sp. TaxID=1871047 RepID=UPI00388EF369
MVSQNVFLLSFVKYGENDVILHCFTQEEGYQSYFMKGIYTKKNKKKAFLSPLHHLTLFIRSTKMGSMQTATKFELVDKHETNTDIKSNTVVFFLADFLNQIVRLENKNSIIYQSIQEVVAELHQKNYQAHLIFLVKILQIQGFAPLLADEIYLNPETGTFSSQSSNALFDEEISKIWKLILEAQNPYEVKIPSAMRKHFLDSLLLFYQYHLTDFKIPQSLEIIQQIFE